MINNERPGVYSSYEVSSAVSGANRGGTVGICAVSASAEKGVQKHITSYTQAASTFGADSPMAALIKIILVNGASAVRAVAVSVNAPASEYASAFEQLKRDEDISVLTCDSRDAAVVTAMKASIQAASEIYRYRIGVAENTGESGELTAKAAAINCERIVLVTAVGSVTGASAAAAAAVIAASGDPAVPLSGAVLSGLNGESVFTEGDINTLVRGGVTPIENVGGEVSVVRAVTTRTKTGGVSDQTWRELSTIRVVDDVIPAVRNSLRTKFARSKNTAQTRGAIRTQVIIELENKLAREIIDSYGVVKVSPAPEDPTVCEVEFEFAVAHGLNRIELNAHITV